MDFKTWLGNLDLFYKYILVFGGVVALVVIFALFKLLLNKRRLRKHRKKLSSKSVTSNSADTDLEICEKNEGSLFGIRAIEAGFFGGVVQSPSNSVPSTPRVSVADQSGKASPLLKPMRPHTTLPTFSPGSSALNFDLEDPDAITPTTRRTVSQPSLKSPPFDSPLKVATRRPVSPKFAINGEGRGLKPSTAQLFGHHSHEPAFATLDPRASPDSGGGSSGETLAQHEQTTRRDVYQHSETLETLTSPTLGRLPLPDFNFGDTFTLTIDRPAIAASPKPSSGEPSKLPSASSSEHSLKETSKLLQQVSDQRSFVKLCDAPPAKSRDHSRTKSREPPPENPTKPSPEKATEPSSATVKHSPAEPTESSESAPKLEEVVDSPRSSTATVGLAEFPTPPSASDAGTGSESDTPTCSNVHVARPQIRSSDTEWPAHPMKAVIDSSTSRMNAIQNEMPRLPKQEYTSDQKPGSRASKRRSRSLENLPRQDALYHPPPSMSQQQRMPYLESQCEFGKIDVGNIEALPYLSTAFRASRMSTDMLEQRFHNTSIDFASLDGRPRSQGHLSIASSRYSKGPVYPSHRASRVESYHSSFSFVPTPTVPEYVGRPPQTDRMDHSLRPEHTGRPSQMGRPTSSASPSHTSQPSYSGQSSYSGQPPHPRPARHSRQSSYSDLPEQFYRQQPPLRPDSRGRSDQPFRHHRQSSSQGSSVQFRRPHSSHSIAPPARMHPRNMATAISSNSNMEAPGIPIPSLEAAIRRKPVSGAYDPESLARFR